MPFYLASAAEGPLTLAEAKRRALAHSRQLLGKEFAATASREAAIVASQLPDPVLRIGIDNLPISGLDRFSVAGVSSEFGIIMLLYLKHAWEARVANGLATEKDLLGSIREGVVLRVSPKAMTVAVIIAGLVPIMLGTGTGSEVMKRIAAPMFGGMVPAPLPSIFVVPAVYLLLRRRQLRKLKTPQRWPLQAAPMS
ncbi:MAG: hypothetical protein NVSMB6_14490 [Burkholderiaceae bacterium]